MDIDAADPATWTDADRKVAAWVVNGLRAHEGYLDSEPAMPDQRRTSPHHLRGCATLRVVSFEGSDGTYGCDTGCEYLRIEGRAACDHFEGVEFTVGEFGELEYWLKGLQPAES